jgi:hypothetical protein
MSNKSSVGGSYKRKKHKLKKKKQKKHVHAQFTPKNICALGGCTNCLWNKEYVVLIPLLKNRKVTWQGCKNALSRKGPSWPRCFDDYQYWAPPWCIATIYFRKGQKIIYILFVFLDLSRLWWGYVRTLEKLIWV